MKFIKTNLNNYIKIKPSNKGLKILKENNHSFELEDGFIKMELWIFMKIFGKYQVMGSKLCFLDMNCEIQMEE